MKTKLVLIIVIILILLIGISIMKFNNSNTSKTDLNIPLPMLALSSDPHKIEDSLSMFLVQQLYRSLFKFTSEGKVVPDLVERLSISSDKRKYLFEIKPEQKFSDGTIITSTDVAKSIRRIFDMNSSIAADINYLEGADKALKLKNGNFLKIKIISQFKIEFYLKYDCELFLTHLALPDMSILKFNEDEVNLNVTSGDYEINYKAAERIRLTKVNATLIDSPEVINLLKLSSENAINAAFEGQVDTLEPYFVNKNNQKELKKMGWTKVVNSLSYENFLLLNPRNVDRQTREFLIDNIVSSDIVKEVDPESLTPSFGIIPPNLPGAISEQKKLNIKKPSLLSSNTILTLSFNEDNFLHTLTASFLKDKFLKLGLNINLEPLSSENYYQILFGKRKETMLIIAGKGIDYPDGLANISYFRTDVDSNFLFMENDSLNKKISKLSKLNLSERISEYNSIQLEILSQKTIVPLFFGHISSGFWSGKIKFVPAHPFGIHFLKLSEIRL